MAVKTVRIAVDQLETGMFVSSLDRPWTETPFPLQGFFVVNHDDINEIRLYCKHVYVDVELGRCPEDVDPRLQTLAPTPFTTASAVDIQPPPAVPRKRIISAAPLKIHEGSYPRRAPVRKEINRASRLHNRLARSFSRVVEDLRRGRELDIREPRKVVNAMVDSVTRNPDAMIWLARVRRSDQYSYHHSIRATIWATIFGRHAGLKREGMRALALGTMLCEVGMTRMPAEILLRKGHLTRAEERLLQQHVTHGLEILDRMSGIPPLVRAIVAAHHEHFDGSGYPNGLRGDRIPYLAKVAGISYTYDALRHPRHDPLGRTPADAMNQLYQLRDTHYQAQLVDEFIKAIGIYPAGTLVELSTREIGVIVEQHETLRLRPKVMVMLDAEHRPLKRLRLLDMARQKPRREADPVTIAACLPANSYRISLDKIQDILFKRQWAW